MTNHSHPSHSYDSAAAALLRIAIINEYKQQLAGRYLALAMFVVMIWDILLTFDQEFKFYYNRNMSIVKLFWFMNRILVPLNIGIMLSIRFIVNPSAGLCQNAGQASEWVKLISIGVLQCVLGLRVIAIYGKNKLVVGLVRVLWVLSIGSRIVLRTFSRHPYVLEASAIANGAIICMKEESIRTTYQYWGQFVYDAFLFILTVGRVIAVHGSGVSHDAARNPIFVQLYKDGALYFFVASVTTAISLSGDYLENVKIPFTTTFFSIGATSLVCSRILLNLRSTAESSARDNHLINLHSDSTSFNPVYSIGASPVAPPRAKSRTKLRKKPPPTHLEMHPPSRTSSRATQQTITDHSCPVMTVPENLPKKWNDTDSCWF